MATDPNAGLQYKPQTAADYATNPVHFDPTGWTRTGGNSTQDVWVNDKTGQVVFVGKDGRIGNSYSSMAAGDAGEASISDIIPGGSGYKPDAATITQEDLARQQLADFANQLVQQRAGYGAGTQAGAAPQIGEFGVTGLPASPPPPAPYDPAIAASNTAALGAYNRGLAEWNASKPQPPVAQPNPNNDPAIAASNTAALGAYNRGLAEWNASKPQPPASAPSGTPAPSGAPAAAAGAPAPATGGPSIYGGPAASMEAAQSMGAPAIDTGALGVKAQTVKPQEIAAPTPITATAAKTTTARAQEIAPPGAVTAQQVGAQQIGPVGLANDANANKTSQQAAQAMLAGAAAGNAPSAAEALLRKGIDENEGAALGMAATLQGSRPGMALHEGLAASRAATAKSAADMAALRANELATGRQQYAESTTAARGQDIQAAATNLQAQVDTLKANQSAALAAGNSNAANALQAQITTLQSQLDASKANQQTALQATLATQSTSADLAKANAANQLQAQIVSMQQQIDVAKQNAANALAAGQSNQAAQLQAQIATMTSQLDGLKANMASALSTATTNAGLQEQANLTNATLSQDMTKFGATQQLSAAEENQKAQLQQQQINNQQYLGLTQLQQQALIAPYQAMIQQQQIAQQQAAANQAMWGEIYGDTAKAVAASDVTLKTDIADGTGAALDFLDALPDPVTYRYVDEKKYYPGKQLGVIAQKLPPAVVTTGPDGKKWISANVIGQVLAGLGNVHRRVREVEQRRETVQMRRGTTRDTVPDRDLVEFTRKLAS